MSRQNTLADPASDRQVAYATTLRQKVSDFTPLDISQREIGDRLWGPEPGPVTKEEASYLISGLLRCTTVDSDRGETVPVGYYWHDGEAYSVVENGEGSARYAKRLVRLGKDRKSDFWRYSRGTIYDLDRSEKVTLAQAVRRFHSTASR